MSTYSNSINTQISDEELDIILKQKFWKSLKHITNLSIEDNNISYLNQYRSALSLWAEHTNDTKQRIICTLDGRDTAWKWSNIKRVTEYFDVKRYSIKAFGIPSQEERYKDNWFKRYEKYFPEEWKVTFFDRSWYNRAWVEAAMWFCTEDEYNWFMDNVNEFEKNSIIDAWINYLKIYLSIKKETQKERLKTRDSAKRRWKSSPIDKVAQEKWNYYTFAKAEILKRTDSTHAPWLILDSNEKYLSSVEIIKAIIRTTSEEVVKLIEKDLSIDLSPNLDIVRTANQELEIMESLWVLAKAHKHFKFKE